MDPKGFIHAAIYIFSSVMSDISGGPEVVSGIGRALPDPIHWITHGLRKPPF